MELAQPDGGEPEELSREDWERAWADEIDRRLADHDAGKARKVDLGSVLAGLRDRIP